MTPVALFKKAHREGSSSNVIVNMPLLRHVSNVKPGSVHQGLIDQITEINHGEQD